MEEYNIKELGKGGGVRKEESWGSENIAGIGDEMGKE